MADQGQKNKQGNFSSKDAVEDLTQQTAKILEKPNNDTQAKQEAAVAAAKDTAAQHKAAQEAAKEQTVDKPSVEGTAITNRVKKTGDMRTIDAVNRYLDTIATATYASAERVTAWQRLVESVDRMPKRKVLDAILKFFRDNADEDFLSEINALQGTTALEPSVSVKVRMLYGLFRRMASPGATRKSLSLETIRSVWQSDDLVNWVAVNLRR